MGTISDYLNSFAGLLYPENMYCVCCGDMIFQRSGRDDSVQCFCENCMSEISWSENNFDCSSFSFNSVLSLMHYDYFAQKIVHNLKFHGQVHLAKPIGQLLGELFISFKSDDEIMSEKPLFVPVPMHPAKIKLRGYNQAAALAKYAAERAGGIYAPNLLIKKENTASMRLARADGRRDVLENSIVFNSELKDRLAGKNAVIVDDVVTTGATAEACARALKNAGAANVEVLCFSSVNYKGNE